MNLILHPSIPHWISIFFVIVIPIPFILISRFVKREAQKQGDKSALLYVSLFFVLYVGYIAFGSFNGWFTGDAIPPKILLFTTFPFAFLLFGVVKNTASFKRILQGSSLENLVSIHIFRLIGVFFILLAFHDVLPKTFAYLAGIGDILTAIGSFFVANAIKNKKNYAKILTQVWNVFGAVDILFTAIYANVLNVISINGGVMGIETLALFPFCIIPAFAPPMILFLHWSIFAKMKNI